MKKKKSFFEKIYEALFIKPLSILYASLPIPFKTFPGKQVQKKILGRIKKTECAFRFIDNVREDVLKPVYENDPFFKFDKEIGNRDFFEFIHPYYRVPYLLYGCAAYELMVESSLSPQELLEVVYKIFIPVRLPGDETYTLYLQRSIILGMTENKIILSHINDYTHLRDFKDFGSKGFEMLFMEPCITYKNKVEKDLTLLMQQKIMQYFKDSVFKHNQLAVLNAHVNKIDLTKKNPDYRVYSQNAINTAKADIFKIMRQVVVSDFGKKMDLVVSYLQTIGVLDQVV